MKTKTTISDLYKEAAHLVKSNLFFSIAFILSVFILEFANNSNQSIWKYIVGLVAIPLLVAFFARVFFKEHKIVTMRTFVEVLYGFALYALLGAMFFLVYLVIIHLPAILAYYITGEEYDLTVYVAYFYFSPKAFVAFIIFTTVFVSFSVATVFLKITSIAIQKEIGLRQSFAIVLNNYQSLALITVVIIYSLYQSLWFLYPFLIYMYFTFICLVFSKFSR